MGRLDPLAIIEATYALERSETDWVRGILDAAVSFDLGLGVASYIAEIGEVPGFRAPAFATKAEMPSLQSIATALPARIWRRIHSPLPATWVEDAMVRALAREKDTAVRDLLGSGPRAWGVLGGDPNHETILLMFLCKDRDALPLRHRATLDCVGAHLGAALRLRRLQRQAPTADAESVEAILSPGGRLLDARGPEAQARVTTLAEAVRQSERARTRKVNPEERLAMWTALVEGRWSIVETTERDGKRMLLAVKNEPRTAAIRKLTTRERSVVAFAALGHSNKYVAYELGIAPPTVSATLTRALRKLGVKSRADLIQSFG